MQETIQPQPVTPMQLGEIFGHTFRILPRLFLRASSIVAAVIIPAAVLFSLASDNLFSTLAEMVRDQTSTDVSAASLPSDLTFFSIAVALFAAAVMLAEMGVTVLACGEFEQKPVAWGMALQRCCSLRFARQIGQAMLEFVSLFGILATPIVLSVLFAEVHAGFALVIGLLLLLAAAGLAIYLKVRWSFTTASIAWEDAGALQAFERSGALVQGTWWRVFGILLLFTILAQIVVGLIQTPLNFVTMGVSYAQYIGSAGFLHQQQMSPEMAARMFQPLGLTLGVGLSVSYIFMAFLQPVYKVVLFFDLRARKGEFSSPSDHQVDSEGILVIPPGF